MTKLKQADAWHMSGCVGPARMTADLCSAGHRLHSINEHEVTEIPYTLPSPLNKKSEPNFQFSFKKSVPFSSYYVRALTPWYKLPIMLDLGYYIIKLFG